MHLISEGLDHYVPSELTNIARDGCHRCVTQTTIELGDAIAKGFD